MRQVLVGTLISAALAIGVAACSGSQLTGSGVVPPAGSTMGAPAGATAGTDALGMSPSGQPTRTATYAVTKTIDTKIWNSPTGSPRESAKSDTGTATVQMAITSGTGKYTLKTHTIMSSGSKEAFLLRGDFVKTGNDRNQYFRSDEYRGTDTLSGKGSTFSGTDEWPMGELGVVFPLKAGRMWSSTGADNYAIDNVDITGTQDGKTVGNEDQGKFRQQANGFYIGEHTWTDTSTGNIEYGERFNVSSNTELDYTFLNPGYGPEIWKFSPPTSHFIEVNVSAQGKPSFPEGIKDVPDWYPGNHMPANLVEDNLTVLPNLVQAPAECRLDRKVQAVREDWMILDPVSGALSKGNNMYYSWSGAFAGCIVEEYVHDLIANGIWYVGWANGSPYYEERGKTTELLTSLEPGAAAPDLTAAPGWLGAPTSVRERVALQRLAAIRQTLVNTH